MLIAMLVCWAYLWLVIYLNKVGRRPNAVIKIHPMVGIEFKGKSLPFKDMENIGETKLGEKGGKILTCISAGQTITIASPRDEAVLISLKNEIQDNSGTTWRKN